MDEQSFRNQFEKSFDFKQLNKKLILDHRGSNYTIAFDQSYIRKSGKCTSSVGCFWLGCAGKAKWGLEIRGLLDYGKIAT